MLNISEDLAITLIMTTFVLAVPFLLGLGLGYLFWH